MITPSDIGELTAKIFDRLGNQFPTGKPVSAMVLVELTDEEDTVLADDGTDREFPATVVLLECTDDRVVVQCGLLEFASRTIVDGEPS